METKAGDPGAFRHFDLNRVPSPAFVVDEAAVRRNLAVLADVRDRAGIKMLAALKAFSFWQLGDVVSDYLDGTCSSGLWEAKLASHHYHGEIATYCAGYKAEDLREILKLSDHVIFNSPGQIARFAPLIEEARAAGQSFDIGLRINPALPLGETEKYDPSQPHSRLGHPVDQLRSEHLEGVSGIHFHSLCEQDLVPLQQIWAKLEPLLEPYFNQLKWLNFGGGHHITRADYQRDELVEFLIAVKARTGCDIYLEPGEAVALDAGILVGELLDVFDNGMKVGITDISATCHMPDVIEAPYRPAMLGERSDAEPIRLGGPSCLAGDIIGDYGLPVPLEPGQRFAFLDQAHYSMVKTNTFNGVPLPSIWLWNSDDDSLREIASFGYETFRDRLG
ncbi:MULTISPECIES: carboxynorspermidine decarboxylase [Pseudomonadota]|jgi:carboxynorspermidine decarboxylase|uniref:carboxynorspermidine decarboxylase n=2 Tax=Pseudomonadota TaxID=1224 RepID=UPI00076A0150|nr:MULTISPECIES: carboxynorspermidine decarboxylase [Pseudomonadota]MAF62729.1 carboxynorspermidine decarboxylase [Blastomonas sp.]MBA4781549.1 carboxynorspermidine decarboxylase [Blastomonas sp.]|tara:strand:- start:124670 stop:125842 length:1173 start_codon:yes stop_codon:yes gene_type:complete